MTAFDPTRVPAQSLETAQLRLVLAYEGEGNDEEYDPADPDDMPFLRLRYFVRPQHGTADDGRDRWVPIPGATERTALPAYLPPAAQQAVLAWFHQELGRIGIGKALTKLATLLPEQWVFAYVNDTPGALTEALELAQAGRDEWVAAEILKAATPATLAELTRDHWRRLFTADWQVLRDVASQALTSMHSVPPRRQRASPSGR